MIILVVVAEPATIALEPMETPVSGQGRRLWGKRVLARTGYHEQATNDTRRFGTVAQQPEHESAAGAERRHVVVEARRQRMARRGQQRLDRWERLAARWRGIHRPRARI